MKKILTWLTLLCTLLSFAALAEEPTIIDPFAEEDDGVEVIVEEATTEAVQALAVPENYPDGEELYLIETGSNPDVGTITVGDMNLEVLEARDADQAEGATLRITAKPGTQLIAFRLYFHPYVSDLTYSQAFDAKIQVGEDLYACRKYVETRVPGNLRETAGKFIGMGNPGNAGSEPLFIPFPYLENVNDRTESMSSKEAIYYMFDVYTLVPEEALADGEPVFLILNLGEKQFWYQAM